MSFVIRELIALAFTRRTRSFILAGSVASYELFLSSSAFAEACRADGLNSGKDCLQYSAARVASGRDAPNADIAATPDLGETGFSISIEGIGDGADAADAVPTTIAGVTASPDRLRQMDRLLQLAGVDLTYDGLGGRPRLAISTQDLRESFVAGEAVTFRASSNYPGWIATAQVVITDAAGRSVAEVPISPNGTASWPMPDPGSMLEDDEEYLYFLRVADTEGRRDETRRMTLRRVATVQTPDLSGPIVAAGEGEDMTMQRGIPVRGGAITVSGRSGSGQPVSVLGEQVAVDRNGAFVIQRILPPGTHAVAIAIDGRQLNRSVTVERSEWFGTGIVDLTIGRQEGESWRLGRVAGFTQGILADGTRITASVDTREEELRDLFRNFGRKHPDQILREIKSEDVFATFGDDSQITDLAPSSGKFFARVEKDNSHLQWGDFKPPENTGLSVRSDRALYGLSGEYRSSRVTKNGDSKLRVTGFGAQADSLMQRDVLRATGGSAYFLSRQDLLVDSETVSVQVVSRTTGLVVKTQTLAEGRDYRINSVQGVVILNRPLSSSVAGEGLVTDNPLGDYDVNLVAQYEYVPTIGSVDGFTAGARGEVWATDTLRFGASIIKDTTGIADNTLSGGDILWRASPGRELLMEYATSEGPGFGSSYSLNGGLDLEPSNPSYGLPGLQARSLRVAGKTDLSFAGMKGEIAGFYDRKDKGFSSPDQDFAYDQQAMGGSGRVALSSKTDITFGGEGLRRDDGLREEIARIGFAHQFDTIWSLEGEIAHDWRTSGVKQLDDRGRRLDSALRLTWRRDDALSAWVFGQATLARDGSRRSNDRLGVGAKMKLSETIDLLGEVSQGSLGEAGRLELSYRPNADTSTTIGYTLDPMRRFDVSEFSGRDRGSLVYSTTSRVNSDWSYTSETHYSAFGTRPALTSGYGVTYTPSERWNYNAMIQYGGSRESDGSQFDRRGVSLGLRYKDDDAVSAALRGEWRQEDSDRPQNALDRDTWLMSGNYEYALSEDWRFVGSVDSVFSESDQSSFRDGRYLETRVGYAWRPVDDDRVNALFSYSYLYDLPGADQVNIDGDINGARQKSHILNAAINWQANPSWTFGAKYGYRLRESAERGSNDFVTSQAHLWVVRADYHVVRNWDIMGELRMLYSPNSNTIERAALLGVYRQFGDNLRVGGGYLWGEVDDDLRKIDAPNKGFFINITSQF